MASQVRRYVALHIAALVVAVALAIVALLNANGVAPTAATASNFTIAFCAVALAVATQGLSLWQWKKLREDLVASRKSELQPN